MAKKADVLKVIDIGAVVSEDERLAREDGASISGLLQRFGPFFLEATQKEEEAKALLAEARNLKAPKTQDQDEAVQVFVKRTTLKKKDVIEHWSVKKLFGGLHKRFCAGEARAVEALDEANRIANQHHNAYAEDARRKAAAEQDRVRRQAEEKARIDRERELLQLEAEALKREEASADLSEREQGFVAAYTSSIGTMGDAVQSAVRMGYKDPGVRAAKLMALPKIQQAIKDAQEAIALRQQAQAKREAPIAVTVPVITAKVSTAVGHDRTTHGYEVVDAAQFILAFRSGNYGIPDDCVQPAPKGLGDLARSLKERINLIPGLRYTVTTKVV